MLSDSSPHLRVSVQPRFDGATPDFYRTINLKGRPAEVLAAELPHWTPANPVLLDLPTGAGKTSFIYNAVIPAVMAQGKNLLLVSNRIALSLQQKQKILTLTDNPRLRLLNDEGIRQEEDFGPVRIITYHRLPALVHDRAAIPWLANVAVAVFDEAHYFAADALFNSGTDYHLRLACERFCHAVRIYMTATSWDLLQPLADAEQRFYRFRPFAPRPFCRECYRYTRQPDYCNYRLHFFENLNELRPRITANQAEKWLIFVDSKERGKKFANELGAGAAYVDADCKGSAHWNLIVTEKKFSTQVLVTTSALDNGVDIVDPDVRHVVVMADNRTALIQMMGRRRLTGGEGVDLWVCDLPRAVIANRCRQYEDWLSWYERADQCHRPEDHQALAGQLWRENDLALHTLFRLRKGRVYPNELARHVLLRRVLFFQRILNGSTTFRREVQSWLGIDPDAVGAKAELFAFYRENGGRLLSEGQQQNLRTLVVQCYAEAGFKESQPSRKELLQARALTNRLREMDLPFSIETRDSAWILVREGNANA